MVGWAGDIVSLAVLASVMITTGVSAESRGLDLSLDRDMTSHGNQDRFGQLTCRAAGNDVTLESVTLIRVKVTGESTELLRVTQNNPANQIMALGKTIGDARLNNNSGYIFLIEKLLNESFCASNYFLCEIIFTSPSGKRDRAIAMTSLGKPEHTQPDMGVSNGTKALAELQTRITDISAAFEMLNKSISRILNEREGEKQIRANISSRISYLEGKIASLWEAECANTCANFSQVLKNLERSLEYLESVNISEETPKEIKPVVCERGMNEAVNTSFVLVTDKSLGREIRCDAQSDGGGWIIIMRRAVGNVDFNRQWAKFRDGFGSLTTDFWLGNEAIHNLTKAHPQDLRIDVVFNGRDYYALYTNFSIENEANQYRLHLSPYMEGTIEQRLGTGMAYSDQMLFSTQDRDNDKWGRSCANVYKSAWWHNKCTHVSLFGEWRVQSNSGVRWYNGITRRFPTFVEMKIRKRQDEKQT